VPRPEPVPSREEAVQLLYDHAKVLTKEDQPGAFDWPPSALGKWPSGLNVQCGWTLMLALLRLLISRDAGWWTTGDNTWSWVISTLYQVTLDEKTDDILKGEAATYALLLLPALNGAAVNDGASMPLDADFLRADLQEHVEPHRVPGSDEMRNRVDAWVRHAIRSQ